MPFNIQINPLMILIGILILIALLVLAKSIKKIPEGYNGWVVKNFGKKIADGGFLALNGEAGAQPDPIQNGWRFKLWPLHTLHIEPMVQIPTRTVGVVISQIGAPLNGTKSAVYTSGLGDYQSVRAFIDAGGQQGVQRRVLAPGDTRAINPFAFLVVTAGGTYGRPVNDEAAKTAEMIGRMDLNFVSVPADHVGVVTTLDGPPLDGGSIAGRIGGFDDVKALEEAQATPGEIIDAIRTDRHDLHSNFENFQAFIDAGGRQGMQHDVLPPGSSYALNPFLVNVELQPMLIVEQGQVAVIKSFIGLPTVDNSGNEYKFGFIVNPGHQGIWSEPLRTGKYPLNPHLYAAIIVPTSILQLNWANQTSEAHNLDQRLSQISAKSKDAFEFNIDLQVQIHVPDVKAARVIASVGTMQNLVNEVLQAAVGNYFRDTLSGLAATKFIETRSEVQVQATLFIQRYLAEYDVETRGVYIQDVILPTALVKVLTEREIAQQEKTTYGYQQEAQRARITLEAQRGQADMQTELAAAQVSVEINTATAHAAVAKADGDRKVLELTGAGEAAKITSIGTAQGEAEKALGLGKAAGYQAQCDAIGAGQTAAVAVVEALAKSQMPYMPHTLITGGGDSGIGGLLQLFLAQATQSNGTNATTPDEQPALTGGAAPGKASANE